MERYNGPRYLIIGAIVVFGAAIAKIVMAKFGMVALTSNTVLGIASIIGGCLLLYRFAFFSFGPQNENLRRSVMANPGCTMIFLGISLVLWDTDRFFPILVISGVFAAITFFYGLILLHRHLGKTKTG